MNKPEEKQTPLGILLIFTMWILIATYFFSLLSQAKDSPIALMVIISIGILFIFLGWGLITFNKWAYYASIIISIIGAFIAISAFPYLIFAFSVNSESGFVVLTYLCFIPMPFYLVKKMNLYVEQKKTFYQPQIKERICTKCFKSIPWDSEICPYCGNKYKNYLK